MTSTERARPGGRSARVQAAVHEAVRTLETERARMSVPQIAERAGVTPSTIYRRWGDLAGLLSDVAVDRLRPDSPPPDLGSLSRDLSAWAEHFADEMSSEVGRSYIRDALLGDYDGTNSERCSAYAAEQIEQVLERARTRNEWVPEVEDVLDRVVAPLMYRILFRPEGVDRDYAVKLAQAALSR